MIPCVGIIGVGHLAGYLVEGLPLADFQPVVDPAAAVRALPISCAAINRSPTLLYPAHPQVEALFGLLGQVHILPDESQFTAASVLSAFYGWVYALVDGVDRWTVAAGVEPPTARTLILETVRGAAEMALAHPEHDLDSILRALATPGGITEQGLTVLRRGQGLEVWVEALESVFRRLDCGNQE